MSKRPWVIVFCGLGLPGVLSGPRTRGVFLFAQTLAAVQAKPAEAKVAATSAQTAAPAPIEKALGHTA